MAVAVFPPWLEWASSMMMAKFRSWWSLLMSSRMKGELLDGADDYLLALFDEAAQVARVVGVAHGGGNLGELADGAVYLVVQHHAVGDYNDGVEDGLAFLRQANQLPRQPRRWSWTCHWPAECCMRLFLARPTVP